MKKPSELQTNVIDWLRFVLICSVVFMHSYYYYDEFPDMPGYEMCGIVNFQVIGKCAVRILFLISGYLFFRKGEPAWRTYGQKLGSRVRSLLIPYLFWNAAALLLFFTISRIPSLAPYSNVMHDFSLKSCLYSFWALPGDADATVLCPVVYQLWFLRDLMVMMVLAPLFYFLVRYTKWVFLAVAGGLLLFGIWPEWIGLRGFSGTAFLFFGAGAWFGINRRNLVDDMRPLRMASFILFPLSVAAAIMAHGTEYYTLVTNISIVIGVPFWFAIATMATPTPMWRPRSLTTDGSFFLYLVHVPWILPVVRTVNKIFFAPSSDLAFSILFFVNALVTIFLALAIFNILQRVTPRFNKFINGGR